MKVEKLICVDESNHNKVYEMHQLSSDSWVAKYGRVGASLTEVNYPMSQWDKKRREKIRKGYKPVTDLVTVAVGPDASTSDLFAKVRNIYAVTHFESRNRYQSVGVSNEKLLAHGSRNENWMSILTAGFKIRPANAIATGSMYGDGIYLANKVRKAIGYTSLRGSYWARGASNRAFIALLNTNCGRMWDVHSTEGGHKHWMTSLTEDKCKQKGYDSVFAAKGVDLKNDEFVVYNGNRVTIKYLVELKEGN